MLPDIENFCESMGLKFSRIVEAGYTELRADKGIENLKRRGYWDRNHNLHETEFLEELKQTITANDKI